MKQAILKILNQELYKARESLEQARKNQNPTSILAWNSYTELVHKLIKRVQDEA